MGEEDEKDDSAGLQLRPYQLEMLEENMRRNIIVAMDTGSGKTMIAVARIRAELERCSADKIVWFLAPTVTLVSQQHHVLAENLPAYQTRSLSGADGVDHWSDQSMWDDVLSNIRIVASTHKVLLDALVHGFVRMSRLALLVFDEAHHCNGNHAANRIMQDFYHPYAAEAADKPAILGLTASPVTKKKSGSLEDIERNLNAISRTPKLHREEMLSFVHRPQLVKLIYPPISYEDSSSQALKALHHLYNNLDIEQDPYVVMLKDDPRTNDSTLLRDTLLSRKTYCQQLMKSFYNKAENTYRELGSTAAEIFIRSCIEKLVGSNALTDLEQTEKLFLKKIFANFDVPTHTEELIQDGPHLSPKVRCLINFLKEVSSADFTGLVFVQTRASVAVLSQLLSHHVSTRNLFRVSTFVGSSSNTGRKFNIGELLDVKLQRYTLDDFRYGQKNLVITTSALEEGIDVSACNTVICFEKPPNFKSFIQRRGRARRKASRFIMMFEEGSDLSLVSAWQELEADMMKRYMDDMRQLQEIQAMECQEYGHREFLVKSTGAKLTLDDAVSHLYHFCATLPSSQYVDLRPVFTYFGGLPDGKTKTIRAKVLLPNSVDASVREAYSSSQWLTEKFAKRDASFEAYVALFNAGLVNENLLPLRYDEEIAEAPSTVDKRPSLATVDTQMSFWSDLIAREWETMPELHKSHIKIYHDGVIVMRMLMILPQSLPPNILFELGCDHGVSFTAKIESASSQVYCSQSLSYYARTTELLFGSVYRNRMDHDKEDFVCLFVPANTEDLPDWLERNGGASPARAISFDKVNGLQIGLIRDLAKSRAPYIFDGVENYQAESQTSNHSITARSESQHIGDEQYLRCIRLTRRGDFIRKGSAPPQGRAPDSQVELLPISRCEVDNLPSVFSWFALLVPSIMHQLEIQALAESLCSSLLPSLGIKDLRLVIAATSTPAAQEHDNYQRLEFIGDSILKLFTSVTLMAQHLHWHEGILSGRKDRVVSNRRLSVAACQAGLAKYIRSAQFTVKKWRPPYISDLLRHDTEATRTMSTKTLADVVEALIGAAYVDGGEGTVIACLAVFLPEISWTPLSQHYQTLCDSYEIDILFPPNFVHVEQLINHTFRHKVLLVEALTHPSHQGPNSTASYQRLEFLGDSVLDNIVVCGAYGHQPPLPTPSLHLIRTVLVNASFLAFLCLSLSAPDARTDIVKESDTRFSTVQTTISLHLWQFMRHTNLGVRVSQQACLAKYELLKGPIIEALCQGNEYPWVLLAQLDAPKYFSDIIESLLGAIYIDTSGSLAACEAFLDRLGIMGYLRLIIREDVALLHPKEKLGQLAGTETVTYTREPDARGEEGGVEVETEQPGKLTCAVMVGDREIVRVQDGISVLEVETRAAAEAVQILELEGRRLPKRR